MLLAGTTHYSMLVVYLLPFPVGPPDGADEQDLRRTP